MTDLTTVSPLRQRMIEDMAARTLNPHTQRSHIYSCQRFAAFLKRRLAAGIATACPERTKTPATRGFPGLVDRQMLVTNVRSRRSHELVAPVSRICCASTNSTNTGVRIKTP